MLIIEGNNNTVTVVNDNVAEVGKNNSDTLIVKGSNNSLGFTQKNLIDETENVNTKRLLVENDSFKNFQNQYTEPTVIDAEESSQVIVINGSYFLADKNLSKIIPPAEAGDSYAQLHLGIANLYGFGTQRNFTKALEWLTLSANSGNEDSQWILGDLYSIGNVIKMDLGEAENWYSKCASTGNDYFIKRLETTSKELRQPLVPKTVK